MGTPNTQQHKCSLSSMHLFPSITLLFFLLAFLKLDPISCLVIRKPSHLKGTLPFSTASFGLPYVTQQCDTHPVMLADPIDACTIDQALASRQVYRKKIVFVARGSCTFVQKAMVVQMGGASGMVVWNTMDDEEQRSRESSIIGLRQQQQQQQQALSGPHQAPSSPASSSNTQLVDKGSDDSNGNDTSDSGNSSGSSNKAPGDSREESHIVAVENSFMNSNEVESGEPMKADDIEHHVPVASEQQMHSEDTSTCAVRSHDEIQVDTTEQTLLEQQQPPHQQEEREQEKEVIQQEHERTTEERQGAQTEEETTAPAATSTPTDSKSHVQPQPQELTITMDESGAIRVTTKGGQEVRLNNPALMEKLLQMAKSQRMTSTATVADSGRSGRLSAATAPAPTQLFTMSDDGNGRFVRIRSVMIGKRDGARIKSSLDRGEPVELSLGYCDLLKFKY